MSDRKYDPEYETELRRNFLSSTARDKFDRWLSELIRKEREEAWDEGFEAAPAWCGVPCGACELCMMPGPDNPYRKEQP